VDFDNAGAGRRATRQASGQSGGKGFLAHGRHAGRGVFWRASGTRRSGPANSCRRATAFSGAAGSNTRGNGFSGACLTAFSIAFRPAATCLTGFGPDFLAGSFLTGSGSLPALLGLRLRRRGPPLPGNRRLWGVGGGSRKNGRARDHSDRHAGDYPRQQPRRARQLGAVPGRAVSPSPQSLDARL